MRPWLRTLLALLLAALVVIGGWGYAYRRQLARQLACFQVGAAESFPQAQAEIAWFEKGPDRRGRLAELVQKWGTGHPQFDRYLAGHLRDPACSTLLEETFSKELSRRSRLLPRWACFWSFQSRLEPDEQIASVLKYFNTLRLADSPAEITWRDVLDLQAAFELIGLGKHAVGLSPANWQEHYDRFRQTRPTPLPHIPRPSRPFTR